MGDEPAAAFEYSGVENLEAMKHAKNYNRFLIGLIQRNIRGRQVLDFGAGAGTFALPLRTAGVDVACVEPDPALREGLEAAGFRTFADIGEVARESTDCVYTLNVLEHIEDDGGALGVLHACLREGGRIIIYVPAFNVLFSSMDRLVGHHRRYRRAELKKKLRAAGFSIESSCYVDSIGFFSALAFRLLGNETGVIKPGAVKIYDRFLFPLSRLLDRLVLGSFGKNLFVVANR